MAAGLPVIASDTPGSRSLIDPGRSGLLSPVGRPDCLAQAINQLLDDPSRRAQIAARARRFACTERFEPQTMITAFEKFFDLLI